ncbi:hypothetical protein [Pseudofrankia asymbiotica]|uniref:Uncharacterized protein n=1 Tax=Pseudofrankia asymbiotica TaxID=1834516 RepID=A0A1V2I4U4_9ACTN|nr:hypothetical protein [Pseudofrankia asymbiotica]ONH25211.1 hypothetical protein BL253_27975 [Pseudofrankia asymbiotica]
MPEFIARRGDDTWLCRCDNTPDRDGFVPVIGRREATTTSIRWRGRYCCLRCGRLVAWPTRQIVGQLDFADLTLRPPRRVKGQTIMEYEQDRLTLRTPVRVRVGDGHIWRFGQIATIDGERYVVDLGRDGTVTTTRDNIRRL